MSLGELLSSLRNLQTQLFSVSVQNLFENQDAETRKRFVAFRQEVSLLVGKLTNAELDHIAHELDLLSSDLKAGIQNLDQSLNELQSALSILNFLGNVLGLVSRVAILV
ncbi:MAG: hypothetical protein PHX83_00585 [Acidobacteriia bacterium]|nr:hypothetical protein [Terriglobia bacterium]